MNQFTPLSNMGNKQRGAGTLLVSVIILALISFVTMYTSKTVLMEQKITNNDYKAKLAFEAAEAGLNQAVASLRANKDSDGGGGLDGSSATDYLFDLNGDGTRTANGFDVGDTAEVHVVTSGDFSNMTITATGRSKDGGAKRVITRTLVTVNAMTNPPKVPIISHGATTLDSAAGEIFNQQGQTTVWSGGAINIHKGKTHTANSHHMGATAADPDYPECMQYVRNCSTTQASDDVISNTDLISNDMSLGQLTHAQFFDYFFGMTPAKYKSTMPAEVIDMGSHTDAQAQAKVAAAGGGIIWIQGDATFDGGVIGCASAINITSFCPAGDYRPPIIIVDGTLTLKGNVHGYAIMYATNDIEVSGTSKIVGALMTAGENNSTGGNVSIHFDTGVVNSAGTANHTPATAAGSWNDLG